MATFVVGATTATFGAMIDGVSDRGGPMHDLTMAVHWRTQQEYENLRGLLSYLTDVIPMPWGNTVEVLVKGGVGVGVLTIAGFSVGTGIYNAYLIEVERSRVLKSGHSLGRARFLLTT